MNVRAWLVILLLGSSTLAAAPCFDHPLTLTELVDIALENNPATQQAWWNARRAAAVLGTAKSAYYPKLDFRGHIDHGTEFQYTKGPDVTYTTMGADVLLGAILYDFGERCAAVEAAQMALVAANWQSDWSIQKVMLKVLDNAYAMLHAQEVLAAARISYDEAVKMRDAAVQLNRVGLTPITDVYTSEATVSLMKMELIQQSALLDIQRGKLAASLGLSADICLEIAKVDPQSAIESPQTDFLIAQAMQQRSDLLAKQAKLSESLYNLDKTFSKYGPKLSFKGSGGADHTLNDPAKSGHYSFTVALDFPIFDGFDRMYQNRIAYADTRLSMDSLAELQLEIALEVLTHSRSLAAAQEMIPDADNNVTNALKAYEGVLQKYQAGKERIAEVSNALRQLATARVRYSDVKTRWLVSMANLAYATGTLVPHMEKSCKK